ncbi:MAG: metal-dependent transcriptional regulator [Fusobacterium sp.]|nr:metal-dependent transcriptional regulator [Fusobacterium sp.]
MENLTQSLQKYLVAIYEVVLTNTAARVKDISAKMSIGMASTSEAVKNLAAKGYINYEPYGIITLTAKGKKAVDLIAARHNIVSDFLEKVLMIDKNDVEICTQNLEYYVPERVLIQLVSYISFMNKCSCSQPKWKQSYEEFAQNGEMPSRCAACAKNSGGGCGCSGCSR